MKPNLKAVPAGQQGPPNEIEALVDTYRLADEASQKSLDQAAKILSSNSADQLSKAQAARSIQQSSVAANQAFDKIVASRATTIEGVLSKLKLWHESVVGVNMAQLSPMEKLLLSVHQDVSGIVQG